MGGKTEQDRSFRIGILDYGLAYNLFCFRPEDIKMLQGDDDVDEDSHEIENLRTANRWMLIYIIILVILNIFGGFSVFELFFRC